MEPSLGDVERVTKALRARPESWRPVPAHGSLATRRWIVALRKERTAFVKIAAHDDSASWLRDEHVMYARLKADFMPRLLGWHDDGESPVLAIEDLSGAAWPPPWTPERVEAVLACLRSVAATGPPSGLSDAADSQFDLNGWPAVAEEPGPFLALGLCSAGWLEASLPTLLEAAEAADFTGDALLHFDVRSDNLCFRDGRTMLIDWNWACVGNPVLDVAAWLPSLNAEGGPHPDEILPDGPKELPALLAGYFCAHAGRPPIPTAPHVRPLQLGQARTALPWAARALGLPPPM